MRPALRQILLGRPGWVLPGASVGIDLVNSRYWVSGQGYKQLTDLLSVTRASVGYAQNSAGLWLPFSNNVLRQTDTGLWEEEQRTNIFLYSQAPATQTITVVSGQTYTVSVYGTASVALSGASSGTATQGNPVTFTASTTSLVCTVSGAGGSFQNVNVELGSFATSPIVTAGTPVTRSADNVTAIGPLYAALKATSGAVEYEFSIPTLQALNTIIGGGQDGGSFAVYLNASTHVPTSTLSSVANLAVASRAVVAGNNEKVSAVFKAGNYSIQIGGGTAGTNTNATAPTLATTYWIGSNSGTSAFLNGKMRGIMVSANPALMPTT